MVKKIKKTALINIIKQTLMKKKYILKLVQHINKKEINLLEFMWLNKYIHGFSLKPISYNNNKNLIIIYSKINKLTNNLLYIKLNISKDKKKIQQMEKWSKNSFFIVITTKGILNIKKSINYKIGGFILGKLH